MKTSKTLALGAFLAASTLAQAHVLIASDDFSYANGNLNAENGGTGWANAWNANTAFESISNGKLTFSGNNDSIATRTLSSTLTDKVIIDFTLSATGTLENNDFLGFWINSATGPNVGLKANGGDGSTINDVFVRTSGTTGAFAGGSNFATSPSKSYHVLAYLYKSSSSVNFDKFALWVDPTAAEMASLTGWDALYSANSGVSSFSNIGFRTVNIQSDDGVSVDNLRIQTVPEPASLALMGLSLLGMGLLRRRKI